MYTPGSTVAKDFSDDQLLDVFKKVEYMNKKLQAMKSQWPMLMHFYSIFCMHFVSASVKRGYCSHYSILGNSFEYKSRHK